MLCVLELGRFYEESERMELEQARAILRQAGKIVPEEITTLNDLSRFGNFSDALLTVAEHIVLSDPKIELIDNRDIQHGVIIASNWQETPGFTHRVALNYPIGLARRKTIGIVINSRVLHTSDPASNLPYFSIDYELEPKNHDIHEIDLTYPRGEKDALLIFYSRDAARYNKDKFINIAKGFIESANILTHWDESQQQSLSNEEPQLPEPN